MYVIMNVIMNVCNHVCPLGHIHIFSKGYGNKGKVSRARE